MLVDLGEEFSAYCPQHSASFDVSYSWQEKVSGRNIQFKRNDRRTITQTGQLLIMYVTQQDLDDFAAYDNQGIRCFMTGAKRFESSGLLKLKKRNSGKFFAFFSKVGILHPFSFLTITLSNPFVVDIYWASLTGKK